MTGIKSNLKKAKGGGGRGGIVASGIGSYFGKDALANFAMMGLGDKRGVETSSIGQFDSTAPYGSSMLPPKKK